MDDIAGLLEAAGSRFSSFEFIGRGSFGDVYKASKESSLKDLQKLAARIFSECKTALEETQNANAEADNKKQQNKELNSNANLSPLARFLFSRWQGHVSRDLNQT